MRWAVILIVVGCSSVEPEQLESKSYDDAVTCYDGVTWKQGQSECVGGIWLLPEEGFACIWPLGDGCYERRDYYPDDPDVAPADTCYTPDVRVVCDG